MISVRQLYKRFGEVVALDGLDLEVRAGEVFGLLGPNGAGKSTTMNCLIGLVTPDRGEVRVLDGTPTERRVRARIGIAPQSLALYLELTARENLRFYAEVYGVAKAERESRVDAALDFVRLNDRQHDRVSGFSGGMQRRLNIACAIVHDPDLILLDEPTVGVDPQSRNAIFDNVEALRARGKTVVYTTHYMEEAERLCDRVGIVDRGLLLAVDTPPRLIAAHGGASTLIVRQHGAERRIETDDAIGALNGAAREAPIEEFQLIRPRLEQVFLHLTGRSLRD